MSTTTDSHSQTSVPAGINPDDTANWNDRLQVLPAAGRAAWTLRTFAGRAAVSTSFGIQSALMLHLVTRIQPDIPVVFIDTGYMFPETYRYAAQLTALLDLNLKIYTPRTTAAWQEALHGRRWELGAEELAAYNRDNKVEPMNRALSELGAVAWLSGLRRSQARSRAELPVLVRQNRTWKVHPVIDWSEKQVWYYYEEHGLPRHPLWEQGYVSVGDWHSSAPLADGMRAEDTRFNGGKRECGLHELSGQADWQI
jgi:phosphoadenosine phosphosulfate reductase